MCPGNDGIIKTIKTRGAGGDGDYFSKLKKFSMINIVYLALVTPRAPMGYLNKFRLIWSSRFANIEMSEEII